METVFSLILMFIAIVIIGILLLQVRGSGSSLFGGRGGVLTNFYSAQRSFSAWFSSRSPSPTCDSASDGLDATSVPQCREKANPDRRSRDFKVESRALPSTHYPFDKFVPCGCNILRYANHSHR